MNLNLIKSLPDYLAPHELKPYFLEVLKIKFPNNLIDKEQLLEALWELSIRQWHTYEIIEMELKDNLEDWLIKNFSRIYSKHLVELVGGIIGMLGLAKAFVYFHEVYTKNSFPQYIREGFEKIIKEYQTGIDDPFADLT